MILTKEQAEARLNSQLNITNPDSPLHHSRQSQIKEVEVIYKDGINNKIGRNGSKDLTEEERIAIGVIATVSDSGTAAELFGVSASHANDLKNGNRNTTRDSSGNNLRLRDTSLTDAIQERIETTKLSIQERVAEKLLSTFGLFDLPVVQEKLTNASPKDIAQVASQMSQVMRNMSSSSQNKSGETGKTNVKIIVHAPKEAREESFDVIEIGI